MNFVTVSKELENKSHINDAHNDNHTHYNPINTLILPVAKLSDALIFYPISS